MYILPPRTKIAELEILFGGEISSSASNLLTCMHPKELAPGVIPADKA
jgi:hypothetical protein